VLCELTIRHVAIIEHVHLVFGEGLNMFTGETGAGKSIVIEALQWVVGGRASGELVRHGAERATVEALFVVPQTHPAHRVLHAQGIDGDEHIIVRRDVMVTGKSTARINGQLVTQATLKAVCETLVTIHGQNDHQQLMRPQKQLQWLDAYGGQTITDARTAYVATYEQERLAAQALHDVRLRGEAHAAQRDLDVQHAARIAEVAPYIGEDEQLERTKRTLVTAEKQLHTLARCVDLLSDNAQYNALGLVHRAMRALSEVLPIDEQTYAPLVDAMSTAVYQLEDVARALRMVRDRLEGGSDALEEINERLQRINALKRTFGGTIECVLEYEKTISDRIEQASQYDETLERCTRAYGDARAALCVAARVLSEARRQCAHAFAQDVQNECAQVHMERTQFVVDIASEDAYGSDGCDRVAFLISPNVGEPLKALAKIASGGECARIMLALQCVLAQADPIVAFVFDEVDAGMSGRAAHAIAQKLAVVACGAQVFAITHLPQLACMADVHFEIVKQQRDGRTTATVRVLDEHERHNEIARMIGGRALTDSARDHAQTLIALAKEEKAQLVRKHNPTAQP
jgi:DNA repair protein RecN (Recombination protein N)